MKQILLIDADSTIPNIPLMKLSQYYKDKGDAVNIVKVGLPYYPNRKKFVYKPDEGYDMYFCSVIFEGNKDYIKGDNIVFGGTGVDLCTNLPDYIEKGECDYSLYPENDTSYGFITRGCIRNCYFCKVPEKEGNIKKVNSIDDIIRHKKVKFLDNNFLAYKGHYDILKELVDRKIPCQFNQGLDIRLINQENSELLSQLIYLQNYMFAFDDWKYRNIIDKKLQHLSWAKKWMIKFFVYVHPNMNLSETLNRIQWLKERRCLPYIMRDIGCWGHPLHFFFVDLAAYCNQPSIFKKMDFEEFLFRRYGYTKRSRESLDLWNKSI